MDKLEIYLKSGHTIQVECDSWKLEYNNETLEYTGYKFVGLKQPKRIGLEPRQIAGYILK